MWAGMLHGVTSYLQCGDPWSTPPPYTSLKGFSHLYDHGGFASRLQLGRGTWHCRVHPAHHLERWQYIPRYYRSALGTSHNISQEVCQDSRPLPSFETTLQVENWLETKAIPRTRCKGIWLLCCQLLAWRTVGSPFWHLWKPCDPSVLQQSCNTSFVCGGHVPHGCWKEHGSCFGGAVFQNICRVSMGSCWTAWADVALQAKVSCFYRAPVYATQGKPNPVCNVDGRRFSS